MSQVISGMEIDGEVLQVGDYILLTQQSNADENGVWVAGKKAEETKRPAQGLAYKTPTHRQTI